VIDLKKGIKMWNLSRFCNCEQKFVAAVVIFEFWAQKFKTPKKYITKP
jgi:hypothetical protein